MNELELCDIIINSIQNGDYNELLSNAESELCDLLSDYNLDDILRLINITIVFHMHNIFFKEIDCEKYQKDKHISLRMLLSLPLFFYKNIKQFGKKNILNYKEVMNELIKKLGEISYIYYYYPCRNQQDALFDNEMQFYMNYFKSYYFDYPCIKREEFINFFIGSKELCAHELGDTDFDTTLKAMIYFEELENNLFNENRLFKQLCLMGLKIHIGPCDFLGLYPNKLIKRICRYKRFNYQHIVEQYAYSFDGNTMEPFRIIDALAMTNEKRFMIITPKNIFFPRHYYWMFQWYNQVWRGKKISENNREGKTIKSKMHENELFNLLQYYFGTENVYASIYLKKEGKGYAEKDFIVLYKNVVLSFEAKSNVLPEPGITQSDEINNIKDKCKKSIEKAYKQSLEVKKAVLNSQAVFYNNDTKKNEIVLDLREKQFDDCIQIVVMYEEFLGIETNIEYLYPEFDAWIVDVKSLMLILKDTVSKGKVDVLFDYAKKRKNAYGLVNVQSGEEMKVYNLYKLYPFLFEKNYKDIGISVNI